jgi:hypothetical protein
MSLVHGILFMNFDHLSSAVVNFLIKPHRLLVEVDELDVATRPDRGRRTANGRRSEKDSRLLSELKTCGYEGRRRRTGLSGGLSDARVRQAAREARALPVALDRGRRQRRGGRQAAQAKACGYAWRRGAAGGRSSFALRAMADKGQDRSGRGCLRFP